MRAGAALALRPVIETDEPFLRRLYASIRESEFAVLGLAPGALDALLAWQYAAQARAFGEQHPGAARQLVAVDGERVGRLYVDRTAATIHVVDIALLPEYRGRGIGTRLLRNLMDEARASRRAVTLHAARASAALGLYRRLGFTETSSDDVYVSLRWPAVS
jgi:ribosomal protein S18 acetylase RimI-like enzyme